MITLRPEVEDFAVFTGATWDTLHVDDFDEARQRSFLGDAADLLLPKEDEEWEDPESYLRNSIGLTCWPSHCC